MRAPELRAVAAMMRRKNDDEGQMRRTMVAVADLLETYSYWENNPADVDLIDSTVNAVARAYLGSAT